jgi:hypothetical protein
MIKQGEKVSGYTILQSVHLDDVELVLGENLDADFRYIVGEYINNGIVEGISSCMVSNDYLEMMDLYAGRMRTQLDKTMANRTGFAPITSDMYEPIKSSDELKGKVVVVDMNKLYRECQTPENMIYFATNGFGTHPNSRGSAVYVENLYTREKSRFERQDVIGIMPKEQVPYWAKDNLNSIVKEFKDRERGDR